MSWTSDLDLDLYCDKCLKMFVSPLDPINPCTVLVNAAVWRQKHEVHWRLQLIIDCTPPTFSASSVPRMLDNDAVQLLSFIFVYKECFNVKLREKCCVRDCTVTISSAWSGAGRSESSAPAPGLKYGRWQPNNFLIPTTAAHQQCIILLVSTHSNKSLQPVSCAWSSFYALEFPRVGAQDTSENGGANVVIIYSSLSSLVIWTWISDSALSVNVRSVNDYLHHYHICTKTGANCFTFII